VTIAGRAQFAFWERIIGFEERTHGNNTALLWRTVHVRTEDGLEFSFTDTLKNYATLLCLLRNRATNAIEHKQDESRKEALGTIADRWTGGQEGQGDRVFHSRTRSARSALLTFWAVTAGFAVAGAWLLAKQNPQMALFGVLLQLLALATGVGSVALTRGYFRNRVLIGAKGITHINQTGTQFIAWGEVDEWRMDGAMCVIQSVHGVSLLFHPASFAYGSEMEHLVRDQVERARRKRDKEISDETTVSTSQTDRAYPQHRTDPAEENQTIGFGR
jgi:hypothetical protein